MRFGPGLLVRQSLLLAAILSGSSLLASAECAYVRVSQVGYEAGGSARAYLMATSSETGATFQVLKAGGSAAYSGKIGALLGTWSASKKLVYQVALDFAVPCSH